MQLHKGITRKESKRIQSADLAAVISNHTVRQERGVASLKQEATTANRGHRRSFALVNRAFPARLLLCSHSARRLKSSPVMPMLGIADVNGEPSEELPDDVPVDFSEVGLGRLFNTVRRWLCNLASVNSLATCCRISPLTG